MDKNKKLRLIAVDAEEAIWRMGGDEALWQRCLRQYPKDKSHERLQAAWQQGDMAEVRRALHMLSGAASLLGMSDICQLCSDLRQEIIDESDHKEETMRVLLTKDREICGIINEVL